ncbi:hypothetical protein WJX72_008918 [[Myrmecia] bisecta]|uniref:Transcription initiation factor TFIID subunit 10 n=1 Tax=[Myrmecia] bisecta TaxID=41462 RepID=A0AAW1R8U3_9CHLO
MLDFLNSLEDFEPAVPDELTAHYLRSSGAECKDIRLVRLVSLAAQKFLRDVTHDALQIRKRRLSAPAQRLKEQGMNPKDDRAVLTIDDLSDALQEYGVNIKPPPYFADRPKGAGTGGR